jgi:hypothetical protein
MLRRDVLPLSALLLAAPLLAQSNTEKDHVPSGTIQLQPALDLQHMRSLLSQMQTNLTMYPSGYSAIKHQAELEVEMWAMLINQMERAQSTPKK